MHDNETARVLPISPDRALAGFATGLFLQTECHRATAVTSLVRDHGVGVVYTVDPKRRAYRKTDVAGSINHTRAKAPSSDLLVDANLYSGKNRKPASAPPTADWVSFQRNSLKLPWAITDSGFCKEGDAAALTCTLQKAAALGPGVITALPIATSWLSHDSDILKTKINDQPNPVALMVENAFDPFDQVHAVAGLVEIIDADVPVLLLRSDTAALGALAYGAAAAAVGTQSSFRHIYPRRDGGGPNNNIHFVIPALLGYYLNSKFEDAYAADPSLAAWLCPCTYCAGLDLSSIASSTEPTEAAFRHSVAAVAELGRVIDAGAVGSTRQSTWAQMCGLAQVEHFAIQNSSGSTWQSKQALAEWLKVTPSTVGR